MRRPDPWRRPAPPSGGDVRSLRLARPAIPSVPRCRQYGSLGWGRQRGVVCAGGGSGDRAASDRGFRRRQAVDLSRRLHFLLPHFKGSSISREERVWAREVLVYQVSERNRKGNKMQSNLGGRTKTFASVVIDMVGSSGWKLALVAARITSSSNQPAEMKLLVSRITTNALGAYPPPGGQSDKRTFSQPGNRKEYGCARRRKMYNEPECTMSSGNSQLTRRQFSIDFIPCIAPSVPDTPGFYGVDRYFSATPTCGSTMTHMCNYSSRR
ncbi:hypothetical protein TRIUR3_09949 [Triticum urartu]|uniref:Uncharacterized protein n=1 Tax=Triticum urartu TaxID=4572 RepID=M7YWQ7_TRIUA|nr:hypothetical protein TRIUR3_09949 [Triticum urartu]